MAYVATEQARRFCNFKWCSHSVRDFVNAAAKEIQLFIKWSGKGINEKGFDPNGNCIVSVDPRYFRPTEVETLLGDARKAKKKLGWVPKITFQNLVKEMIEEDFNSAKRDQLVKSHGFNTLNYYE